MIGGGGGSVTAQLYGEGLGCFAMAHLVPSKNACAASSLYNRMIMERGMACQATFHHKVPTSLFAWSRNHAERDGVLCDGATQLVCQVPSLPRE